MAKSLGALDCKATAYTSTNPMAGTLGGFDEEDVKVTWLSRALMTVTESGSLDCGGAHPYNHFDVYTFDLLRGEYLDWNRVFDAYVPGKRTFGGEKSAALLTLVKQAVDQGRTPARPTSIRTWRIARTCGRTIWRWARRHRAH